jgi:hypothetical protein
MSYTAMLFRAIVVLRYIGHIKQTNALQMKENIVNVKGVDLTQKSLCFTLQGHTSNDCPIYFQKKPNYVSVKLFILYARNGQLILNLCCAPVPYMTCATKCPQHVGIA